MDLPAARDLMMSKHGLMMTTAWSDDDQNMV